MSFVRIGDVLLHYGFRAQADRPVLVLVNSLGTDARIWDDMVAELGADYAVLSYDKRGHGLSDAPGNDYTLDDHIADLEGLLRHLEIGQFILVGVSVGGLIAQGFALRHPEKLTALVLCDTAPHIGDEASWNARIAAVREKGMVAIADGVMERWFSREFRDARPDELAGWRNLFLRTDVEGYAATCATLRDTDLSMELQNISTPTLVVVGSEDGATPVATVKECARAIAGSRFEIIEGAGHIPSLEKPVALVRLISDFVTEVGNG